MTACKLRIQGSSAGNVLKRDLVIGQIPTIFELKNR